MKTKRKKIIAIISRELNNRNEILLLPVHLFYLSYLSMRERHSYCAVLDLYTYMGLYKVRYYLTYIQVIKPSLEYELLISFICSSYITSFYLFWDDPLLILRYCQLHSFLPSNISISGFSSELS